MNEYFNISNFLNLLQTLVFNENGNEGRMKREEAFNINNYNIENNNVLNKCINVLKNDDEWKYLLGIGQDLGRNLVLGFDIIILLYMFITLLIFIKNINQFMISIRGPSFCIMVSIGCFILVLTSTIRRVNIIKY